MLFDWANHLINEKRGHDIFDFTEYHFVTVSCGSRGCAIGELPFVFPDKFHHLNRNVGILGVRYGDDLLRCPESLSLAFNLQEDDSNKLYEICHESISYQCLSDAITAPMVGNKIFELATELESKYFTPSPCN